MHGCPVPIRCPARLIAPDEKHSPTRPCCTPGFDIIRSITTLSFFSQRERMIRGGIADVVDMKQMVFLLIVVLAAMVPAALASDGCQVERVGTPMVPLPPDTSSILDVQPGFGHPGVCLRNKVGHEGLRERWRFR